ncbi:MAG: CDP-alcohol phosphatidyltransferase family protein [Candidatus Lokiarchaeota archaeon]|nr:CDP-alcohol phosphatidyltransferase family protein [Candidatus Lokiarchaeota archaeon]
MPSRFRVRYIFRPLVKLIARGANKIGLSPNMVTCLMLVFACMSFMFLVIFTNYLLFSIFVFCTGIFDGVDGALARMTGKATKKGAFFDSTMDRVSEFVIFFALLLHFWNFLFLGIDMKLFVFILFLGSIMISYSRARIENFSDGDFDIGLMARSERLFYLVITSLISFFFGYFEFFVFIFMWLVILTAFYRFINFKRILKSMTN